MSGVGELARALAIPGPLRTSLRQGVVQSVQATTLTVRLGGGTTDVAGVAYLRGYVPIAADTVWIVQSGPDLLVVGAAYGGTTGIGYDRVATSQGTTSLTYTNLATTGPQVLNLATGTLVKISLSVWCGNGTISDGCLMSVDVSGATTVAARDIEGVGITTGAAANNTIKAGHTVALVLNAGVHSFVAKYRAVTGGTATFLERLLMVERVN
jgi:hypothetical protein